MKYLLTTVLLCFAFAGCGVNSIIHNQSLWCVYHAYRLEQDISHHHYGWAGFQALLAAHHCGRAL